LRGGFVGASVAVDQLQIVSAGEGQRKGLEAGRGAVGVDEQVDSCSIAVLCHESGGDDGCVELERQIEVRAFDGRDASGVLDPLGWEAGVIRVGDCGVRAFEARVLEDRDAVVACAAVGVFEAVEKAVGQVRHRAAEERIREALHHGNPPILSRGVEHQVHARRQRAAEAGDHDQAFAPFEVDVSRGQCQSSRLFGPGRPRRGEGPQAQEDERQQGERQEVRRAGREDTRPGNGLGPVMCAAVADRFIREAALQEARPSLGGCLLFDGSQEASVEIGVPGFDLEGQGVPVGRGASVSTRQPESGRQSCEGDDWQNRGRRHTHGSQQEREGHRDQGGRQPAQGEA